MQLDFFKIIILESVSFHHEMFNVTNFSPQRLYCPCGDFNKKISSKHVQELV